MSEEKKFSDEDNRMIRRRLSIEPYKIPDVAVVNYLFKKENRVLIRDHIKVIEELQPETLYPPFTEGVLSYL